ncbi:MAG: amino acid permease [Acidobacteria bacterium]|nr:amino acid permease [Acidobacteriota bacterium]
MNGAAASLSWPNPRAWHQVRPPRRLRSSRASGTRGWSRGWTCSNTRSSSTRRSSWPRGTRRSSGYVRPISRSSGACWHHDTVPALSERSGISLERRLGPVDGAALVVSNVIGGGIFFVPILVAQAVSEPRGILLVWLAGGALAFAGAMAYAELASLRPRAGGEYVYLREAYGPLAGFLSGWTSFVAGFSGAIAASSVALAEYVGRFVPLAADPTPLLTIPLPWLPLVVSPKTVVALAVIVALTLVHLRGLGPGRLLQNILAGAKVSALVVFIALGFSIGRSVPAPLAAEAGGLSAAGFLLALIPVMFTYSGWNAAAYVAEEVRSPGRNVPIALGLGTLAVVAIYLGLNALYLYALSAPGLAAVNGTLIDTVADRLFGLGVGHLIAAFTIVSIAASVSAMVLAGPRVYFAMARDGLFLKSATRIHPRFRAPTVAIITQTLWSGVLVLSGTLSQLVSYTGFAVVLFSGAAVAAVFVFRRREPDAPRPFSAWGYPWAPALFVTVSAVALGNDLWRNRGTALAGLAVISLGIPVYFWMRRRSPE